MKIITPENCKNWNIDIRNAVFLAGPCPRNENQPDWRDESIEIFKSMNFNGDIINPTNRNYDGELEWQTDWEHYGMCVASIVLFWIPRSEENPALTTNIEFGEWKNCERVIVGFPNDAEKMEYIEYRAKKEIGKTYNALADAIKAAVDMLQCKNKIYVTSDTHFSQERTRELSYRPWRDVKEMDCQLISNWNKRVTMNDIVIHLGDFGNPEIIHHLNFETMYFLRGNYEFKDKSIVKKLNEDKRVIVFDGFEKKCNLNGKTYYLVHEPLGHNDYENDKFYLFGHIHRLQMVKRNGINVGVDGNRFKPMSISEIEFLRGGVEKYFDENVFREFCQ